MMVGGMRRPGEPLYRPEQGKEGHGSQETTLG